MTDQPVSFEISEFTIQSWSFVEDVERYAELGVDTIEVVEAKLDDERLAQQMGSIADAGLDISGCSQRFVLYFRAA